jgi:hypothetical protein
MSALESEADMSLAHMLMSALGHKETFQAFNSGLFYRSYSDREKWSHSLPGATCA